MLAKQLNDAILVLTEKLPEYLYVHAHTFNIEFADAELWEKAGKPYTWKLQEVTNDLIVLYDYSHGVMAAISIIDNEITVGKNMMQLKDYVILNHEYFGVQSSIFKRVS